MRHTAAPYSHMLVHYDLSHSHSQLCERENMEYGMLVGILRVTVHGCRLGEVNFNAYSDSEDARRI